MQFRKLLKQIAAKQGAKQPVESFDPLNINADDPILQIFAINIHTQTSGNNINSIHKGWMAGKRPAETVVVDRANTTEIIRGENSKIKNRLICWLRQIKRFFLYPDTVQQRPKYRMWRNTLIKTQRAGALSLPAGTWIRQGGLPPSARHEFDLRNCKCTHTAIGRQVPPPTV